MTMTHHAILVLFAMVLGSCVGSFLSVCAYRIPRGMSVLRPRSRCPRCGAAIRAHQNLPVMGWLLLRGRCRACRGPISWRYPAIELAVGALYAAPYLLAVWLYRGDAWDRIGVGPMLALLVTSWSAASLGVLAVAAGGEVRRSISVRPAADRHRAAGGCEVPASSALRTRAGRG